MSVFFVAVLFINSVLLDGNLYAEVRCRQGNPYYFAEFDPASLNLDKELNYEEVYRNYEFFEVFFSKGCDEIEVRTYKKGQLDSSERYKIRDGYKLEKVSGDATKGH